MSATLDEKVLDPGVREQVTRLLYSHLPALYRVLDMAQGASEPLRENAPRGAEELYKLIRVLAVPLARVRQNVDELHADLFIDKSADWVLPYLAQMIGMQLVFPDAPSNRRDVRGTVGWRRQKGTPAMLEAMASDLSGQMVVTQEGWKRILLAQDLNLHRPSRTIANIGPASIAERATGPLDSAHHAVDPRRISRTTGRYHPKHVAHWLHPTRLFPLREGEAASRNPEGDPPDVDYRFAFHPLGADVALRVRRATSEDDVATDRVPPMVFAEQPGAYFDQQGTSSSRFTVRFVGLPAAVAEPQPESRAPSDLPAEAALVSDRCDVRLLAHTADRLSSPVTVTVLAVPLIGAGANEPDKASAQPRGSVLIEAAGGTSSLGTDTAVAAPYIAMLRLTAAGGGGYFPGATIEIAGQSVSSRLAASDPRLAELGFLSGILIVQLPATWVVGERWFFLAADGSVFDADPSGTNLAGTGADVRMPGETLTVGPGPAWPPLPLTAEHEPWRHIPAAVARGPVVVHGPGAVDRSGASDVPAGAGVEMGLVFALRIGSTIRPFLRLDWIGPNPTAATTWTAFDADGAVVTTADDLQTAMKEMAELAAGAPSSAELWVRLESDAEDIALPPCEVAYTSDRGEALLIHLPELTTAEPALPQWEPTLDFASRAVSVNADGSTFGANTLQVARFSCGPIVPIREAKSLRRRVVRRRTLCWWKHEDPMSPEVDLATPEGHLDIDPAHGLFAFAKTEPAPVFTLWASHAGVPGWPPAAVTVDCQEGYSQHTGARPDAREPILDAELPRPTRLVIGAGSLHRGAPLDFHEIPRYATLSAALAAIGSDPSPSEHEVVQLEDSATYEESSLTWPDNITSLTVQAAELTRPVIRLQADWKSLSPPTYDLLVLRGLVIEQTTYSGDPPVPTTRALELPPAKRADLQLCTAATPHDLWELSFASNADAEITLFRCVAGKVAAASKGKLVLVESVVAAAGGRAVDAPLCEVECDRVTVVAERADLPADGFAVDALVLEVSETIFTDLVRARDRFRGCIRYSRAEAGSLLPRKHRVTEDAPLFVTRDRTDPAHVRLSETCPRTVTRGAEDGSEMGAFHGARLAQRGDALSRRLIEYTPAGLSTGLLRLD